MNLKQLKSRKVKDSNGDKTILRCVCYTINETLNEKYGMNNIPYPTYSLNDEKTIQAFEDKIRGEFGNQVLSTYDTTHGLAIVIDVDSNGVFDFLYDWWDSVASDYGGAFYQSDEDFAGSQGEEMKTILFKDANFKRSYPVFVIDNWVDYDVNVAFYVEENPSNLYEF